MGLLPSCPGALLASVLLALLSEARGDCGPPKSLPNARIREEEKESYPVGASLTYACIPGYKYIPGTRPRIRCLETAQWSEVPAEICTRARCPVPNIPNGRIEGDSDLLLGDQITFACDEGYRPRGKNGARCIVRDNKVDWDHDPPHCERIPCYPPPQIANGKHDGLDEYVYGTAVSYRCDHDYSLIGSNTLVCTFGPDLNGKWNKPAPECKVVKCILHDIENGFTLTSYQPSYTYEARIIVACRPGFKLKNNHNGYSSCGADSQWHPPIAECALDISPTVPSGGDGKNDTSATEAPELPTDEPASDKSVLVAVGGAAAVAVIAIFAIIVALKCRARHKRQGKTVTGSAPESYTAVPHNADILLEEKA